MVLLENYIRKLQIGGTDGKSENYIGGKNKFDQPMDGSIAEGLKWFSKESY